MKFTKMQGCGNDYIYVNCFTEKIKDPARLAVKLSDRHYGIGSDGLILIEPSESADAYMHMFNKDGSEGSMCGNGIRCTAKYLYDNGMIPAERDRAVIDTAAGVRVIILHKENGKVRSASVDMGAAVFGTEKYETIHVAGMELKFIRTDMGNPHAVFFIEDNPCLYRKWNIPEDAGNVSMIPLAEIGPEIENHETFPDKVNVEFAEVLNRREIKLHVWERGSGETMACGTGATASAAAGYLSGKVDSQITVRLKGGDLEISYDRKTGHWFMTGMAEEVFEGTVSIDCL